MSPGANLPEELDAAETTCVFSKAELGNAPVRFAVRPANCWGVVGRAIADDPPHHELKKVND